MKKLINIIEDALSNQTFIKCTFSNPRRSDPLKKITATYVSIQDTLCIQFTLLKDTQAFHENIPVENMSQIQDFINLHGIHFKQVYCATALKDYHVLINKKGETTIKIKPPTLKPSTFITHNRQKKYILDTPSSIPFLKALGLMDEHEKIKPSKYDKYKQINRYLEIITDTLEALPNDPIRIVDFGCGKSYLTFALYHYLNTILNRKAIVIGLDLKEDVINFCNELATQLNYTDLKFQIGDIGQYTTDLSIDLVISLHACNTATDSALEKALSWQAKVILAVPCCHHEAYTQIQSKALEPILKYGLLKERISALITDGLRANLLEIMGYQVSIVEFIDMEHTPKNILLRAILKPQAQFDHNQYQTYQALCDMLHLDLSLAKKLKLPRGNHLCK